MVVKGDMKTVVAHRGGAVLGTGGVNVLLFNGILIAVVIFGLLVTVAVRAVVLLAVVKCFVTSPDGTVVVVAVVVVALVVLVAVNWTEAVVVSRGGGLDGT